MKVRVPEEEDIDYPESDSGRWVFLKFIESLYFQEEKNQTECPLSASKNKKACPQHLTLRSTPSTKGILKNSKQVGESPKENARASSVLRPRAVLSSPDNDVLVGSINDLNNNISSTQKKKDARGKVGGQARVLSSQVKVGERTRREVRHSRAKLLPKQSAL